MIIKERLCLSLTFPHNSPREVNFLSKSTFVLSLKQGGKYTWGAGLHCAVSSSKRGGESKLIWECSNTVLIQGIF